jgi:hypothetical protein
VPTEAWTRFCAAETEVLRRELEKRKAKLMPYPEEAAIISRGNQVLNADDPRTHGSDLYATAVLQQIIDRLR